MLCLVLLGVLILFAGPTHFCLAQTDQASHSATVQGKKKSAHPVPMHRSKRAPKHSSKHAQGRPSHRTAQRAAKKQSALHGKGHATTRQGPRKTKQNAERVRQLRQAFVASSQLRPMAQQLAALRSPAAYAAVARYARQHTGEAASAAYLALGNAYCADHRYTDAVTAFQRAHQSGHLLADYADYLGAKAEMDQQQYAQSEALLAGFRSRYPESILDGKAGLLLAQVYLAEGDPQGALRQLAALDKNGEHNASAYLLALAQAQQMAGNRDEAVRLYKRAYTEYAASDAATQAVVELHQMGLASPFTVDERVQHAEGMARAHNDAAAAEGYRSLAEDPSIAGTATENVFLAKALLYDFRREHHVPASELARLSDTNDEAGALRLYLMVESARDRADTGQVRDLLQQMLQRFPANDWTAEALFSAGNMALLANDMPTAIQDYSELVSHFPSSGNAAISHWHVAWLNYRIGDKKTAAQLFEQQIVRYPNSPQAPAALYWRGRVYQDAEKNGAAASTCYNKLVANYRHYYYADLARKQLATLRPIAAIVLPFLADLPSTQAPTLSVDVPADDVHVARASLLANADLDQYIAPEIKASPDNSAWGAYAEAQLYASNGETFRALHTIKRATPAYFALPIQEVPRAYWELLFPRHYWSTLVRNAEANGLDPYLVAALIRQESEFNPGAVSYANAYGLMQLLPAVGRAQARKLRLRSFRTSSLLGPSVNLQLGAAYLRQLLDGYSSDGASGQTEYALASYNAGEDRVKSWLANGPYADIPEFVESIPFTQTREYVQAVLRNRKLYERLYGNGAHVAEGDDAASK